MKLARVVGFVVALNTLVCTGEAKCLLLAPGEPLQQHRQRETVASHCVRLHFDQGTLMSEKAPKYPCKYRNREDEGPTRSLWPGGYTGGGHQRSNPGNDSDRVPA